MNKIIFKLTRIFKRFTTTLTLSLPTFIDKMDSISDKYLANQSDHHGCSTGVGKGWYEVCRNGKHVRTEDSPEAPQDATSYLKAVLKVGSSTHAPSEQQSWSVPPSTVKVEPIINCHNRYEALFDEEQSDDSGSNHPPAVKSDWKTQGPPKKKIKIKQEEDQYSSHTITATKLTIIMVMMWTQ